MTDTTFMRVEDVANELSISKSYAYKIVQKLSKDVYTLYFENEFYRSTNCMK